MFWEFHHFSVRFLLLGFRFCRGAASQEGGLGGVWPGAQEVDIRPRPSLSPPISIGGVASRRQSPHAARPASQRRQSSMEQEKQGDQCQQS